MSFRTASAIMRGGWLIDKQWADAHMRLVFAFMKGDASAARMLMGDDNSDDDDEEISKSTDDLGLNVFSITPGSFLGNLPKDCIVYIEISGPMFKSGDWCSYGMEDYAELLYKVRNNANIGGVIIDFDTPGGEASGTATMADAITACKALKPVIGFVDDSMCASSGYWQLSACTEIYANQITSTVGSVGVYCTIADWNAYYISEGLPVHDVYAPESTDKNQEYIQSVAGKDELLKEKLSVIAQAFISAVKTNRYGKIVGMDWAKGAMYFPAEAQKLGLIDGIKNYDQVVQRMNTLIRTNKSNSKTNNMAFEKLNTLAGYEGIEVVDGGFRVEEKYLNALVAGVSNLQTQVETLPAQLQEANEKVTALTGSLDKAQKDSIDANEKTVAVTKELATANERIKELEAMGPGETAGTVKEEDKTDPKKVNAMEMPFQKELKEKYGI